MPSDALSPLNSASPNTAGDIMVQQAFSQILGGLEAIAQNANTQEQRRYVLSLYRLVTETARLYDQSDLATQLMQEGQKLVPKVFHEPPKPTDSHAYQALFKYFTQQGLDLARLYPQSSPPAAPPIAKPPAHSSGLEKTVKDGGPNEKGLPSVTNNPVRWGYLRELVTRNNGGNAHKVNADIAYIMSNLSKLPEGTLSQEQGGHNRWMYDLDKSEAIERLRQNPRRHSRREPTSPPGHRTGGMSTGHFPSSTGTAHGYEKPQSPAYAARPATERPPRQPHPPAESGIKRYDPLKTYEADYFRLGDTIITPGGTSGKVTAVGKCDEGRISITIARDDGKGKISAFAVKTK